jgi:hypothetical protein
VLVRVESLVSVDVAADEGRDEVVVLLQRRAGVCADPRQILSDREPDVARVGDHCLDLHRRSRLDAGRAGLRDVDRSSERARGCVAGRAEREGAGTSDQSGRENGRETDPSELPVRHECTNPDPRREA